MAIAKKTKQSTTKSSKSPSKSDKQKTKPFQQDPPIIVKGGSFLIASRNPSHPTLPPPPPHPARPHERTIEEDCDLVAVYHRNEDGSRGDFIDSFSFDDEDGRFWIEFS